MRRPKQFVFPLLATLLLATVSCSTGLQPFQEDLTALQASILSFDDTGTYLLDIPAERFAMAGYRTGDLATVSVGDTTFVAGIVEDEKDAGKDLPTLSVAGPSVTLSARTFGLSPGKQVTVGSYLEDGYRAYLLLHDLPPVQGRDAYRSDRSYADFRPIGGGTIAQGRIYRAAIGPNRAPYVDALAKKAGIKTILDFSDKTAWGENTPYGNSLMDAGALVTLRIGTMFEDVAFARNVGEGLRFLAGHSEPYLVCGDDTGFVAVLVSALMGSSIGELTEDYMQTFVNYQGFGRKSEEYRLLSNIPLGYLRYMNGGEPVSRSTVEDAAVRYLTGPAGLSVAQVQAIRERLRQGSPRFTGTLFLTF
jgi:hypothetical protein